MHAHVRTPINSGLSLEAEIWSGYYKNIDNIFFLLLFVVFFVCVIV